MNMSFKGSDGHSNQDPNVAYPTQFHGNNPLNYIQDDIQNNSINTPSFSQNYLKVAA